MKKPRHCSLCKHFWIGRRERGCKAGEKITVPEFDYPNIRFKYCNKFEKINTNAG